MGLARTTLATTPSGAGAAVELLRLAVQAGPVEPGAVALVAAEARPTHIIQGPVALVAGATALYLPTHER